MAITVVAEGDECDEVLLGAICESDNLTLFTDVEGGFRQDLFEDGGTCSYLFLDPIFLSRVFSSTRGGRNVKRWAASLAVGEVSEGTSAPSAVPYLEYDYEAIMAEPLKPKELEHASALVQFASFTYNEEAVLAGGEATEQFLKNLADTIGTTDRLLRVAGTHRRARIAFMQRWWTKHPRAATPDQLGALHGVVDSRLLEYVHDSCERGVRVRDDNDADVHGQNDTRAHQSLEAHQLESFVKVWEDFARGGALLFSCESEDLFADANCQPMGRVPKSDDDGFKTSEGRFVYDGSHGGASSVNSHTPMDRHPPAVCPLHAELIAYLVWLTVQVPGVPVLFVMRDVKAAFKLVWVGVADQHWFGTRLPASALKAFASWATLLVVFTVLVFGWAESPGEYGMYGWAIAQTHRSLSSGAFWDWASLAFFSLTYVDDGVIVEPDLGKRMSRSCSAYDWALACVLGPKGLNQKKLATTGAASNVKVVWGIEYDLKEVHRGPQYGTLSMTASKKSKMLSMMTRSSSQPGARRVTKRDHGVLVGNVQWWSTCSPALRAVLPLLYIMPAEAAGAWLAPSCDTAAKWKEYDEGKALLQLLVRLAADRPDLMQTNLVYSLDAYGIMRLPEGLRLPVRYIGSDANGLETGGVLSALDYTARVWTFAQASEYAASLMAHCASDGATVDKDLIICVTELLAVAALAAEMGSEWPGHVVIALIDNDNAKCAIRSRTSRNRYVRYLLMVIAVYEHIYKFKLVAYYVGTKNNWMPDFIGRDADLEVPKAGAVARLQAELIDPFLPGFKFIELGRLLRFFATGDAVMKSFALPGGETDGYDVGFEAGGGGDATHELSAEIREQLLAGYSFGELCAGTLALSRAFGDLGLPCGFLIEHNERKLDYARDAEPEARWCRELIGEGVEYEHWAWLPGERVPRAIGGGPPCRAFSLSGRQQGMAAVHLSDPMTAGVARVARAAGAWFIDVENVPQAATLNGGDAITALTQSLEPIWRHTPYVADNPCGVEILEAADLGGWALRRRLAYHAEAFWVEALIGSCWEIPTPTLRSHGSATFSNLTRMCRHTASSRDASLRYRALRSCPTGSGSQATGSTATPRTRSSVARSYEWRARRMTTAAAAS